MKHLKKRLVFNQSATVAIPSQIVMKEKPRKRPRIVIRIETVLKGKLLFSSVELENFGVGR